jgi:protocatechuate 3,4-dioxygenase beta subunit
MRKIAILIISLAFLATNTTLAKAGNFKTCYPQQNLAEGPYYLPSSERSKLNIKEIGHSIEIKLTILNINCKPLKGLKIAIWHNNALGNYTTSKGEMISELRGFQNTDINGSVNFKTILPGWYPGRAPHIHIKIINKNKTLLTTQMFFKKTTTNTLYKKYPYNKRGKADTDLLTDSIFNSIKNKEIHLLDNDTRNLFEAQITLA